MASSESFSEGGFTIDLKERRSRAVGKTEPIQHSKTVHFHPDSCATCRQAPKVRYRGVRANLFDLRRVAAIQNPETVQRWGTQKKPHNDGYFKLIGALERQSVQTYRQRRTSQKRRCARARLA